MSEQIIYEKLKAIFDDIFDAGDVGLTADTVADDVPGWDSLNHIRLILAVQKVFKVKFSAHEIGGLHDVGSLVTLIQTKSPSA